MAVCPTGALESSSPGPRLNEAACMGCELCRGLVCSGWWFVLSEVLGYQNVKVYDGSTQEWAADANAPMIKYSWK